MASGSGKKGRCAGESELKLPHNLDAECAVFGAVLLDNAALRPAMAILEPRDFVLEAHRRLFARIVKLSEENRPVDLVTLHDELERAGELEAAGGSTYLSSLVDGVPRVSHIEHYARIVKDKALLRSLACAADAMKEAVLDGKADAASIISRTRSSFVAVEQQHLRLRRPVSAGEFDGAALVRQVEQFIRRFVVLPPKVELPVALWVIATHLAGEFETFPYLALVSPTKGCGKTRLTEVIELLGARVVRTANISEAALYRLIEQEAPTLVLDEAEMLSERKSERGQWIRGLLNAGNRRNAVAHRVVGTGANLQVQRFHVYGPKVVCAIGRLPDTLMDRSIVVSMQRRAPNQQVERFLPRVIRAGATELYGCVASWVEKQTPVISEVYSAIERDFLPSLSDRDAEAWEPLFAVLSVADPARVEELRECAGCLWAGKVAADIDDSLALRLLADIATVWPEGAEAALTADLLGRLRALEDAPWSEDAQLNPRRLARWLGPFEIRPRTVRTPGGGRGKGYTRSEVDAAADRYLSGSVTSVTNRINGDDSSLFRSVTTPVVTDAESKENPQQDCIVTDVTDQEQEDGRTRHG